MTESRMKLTAELNAVRVMIEDLLLASKEVHGLPPEDRDWEGRLHLMVRLFSGEPNKALAVEHRLMAMSKLVSSGVLPHWALPESPDGATQIAEPVWLATASEPLLLAEREPFFEPSSFLHAVLSFAEPDGHASLKKHPSSG